MSDTVCHLTLCHPSGNPLTAGLCAEIAAALDWAMTESAVAAVVIDSAAHDFSHGLAPQGDGHPDTARPDTADIVAALCRRIEDARKPVIVALTGRVMAEGVELALAAHARIANADARFSLPAVTLGLVPGAGGSQRLPRLIGAEQALRLLLTATPVTAVEGLAMGLLDRVVDGDPLPAAVEIARALAGKPPRRTMDCRNGLRDALTFQRAVTLARSALHPGPVEAPARIIACVEAALLLPAEQALKFEAAQRADLAATPAAAGLRHAAKAERRALRLSAGPEADSDGPSPAVLSPVLVSRLMIWGAGGPAPDIALRALRAGMHVTLADPSRPGLVTALESIAVAQEQALKAGTLTQSALDDEWARLSPQLAPPRLTDADVALILGADAPPASAASAVLSLAGPPPVGGMALSLSGALSGALSGIIAGGAGDLVEIAVSDTVAPARLTRALTFARRIGWRAIVTRNAGPGSVDAPVPVAVRLARAIAETLGHLERGGTDRAVIARALAAHGIAGRGSAHPPTPDESDIARRCLAALANAGARLIETGVLHRPIKVDMVAIGAGLMARHTGGPMYQADRRGMLMLVRDLRLWAGENPALWQPAPLIEALWSQGLDFASLDAAPEALARALPGAFARAARAPDGQDAPDGQHGHEAPDGQDVA